MEMTLRLPTDAQARLLAFVEHERPVFLSADGNAWKRGDPEILGGDGVQGLEGRAIYPKGRYRPATVQRCADEGWIVPDVHGWLSEDGNLVVDISDDGRIALGLWRQRQMTKPPEPDPILEGGDRDVVALAERAMRLGYKIAPTTQEARTQAKRLRREDWVTRGFIGVSTSSVEPTPMGVVEVNPAAADIAQATVLTFSPTNESERSDAV